MKRLFYLLLLLASCNKDSSETSSTPLKGTLKSNCTGAPVANATLALVRDAYTGAGIVKEVPAETMEKVTTDANGEFNFTKVATGFKMSIAIEDATIGGRLISGNFDNVPNNNIGELYAQGAPTKLILKWKNTANWTAKDSVRYIIQNLSPDFTTRKVMGQGQELTDTVTVSIRELAFTSSFSRKFLIGITSEININGSKSNKTGVFNIEPCQTGFQTVVIDER
jgi:hypothetical protein